jgi:hypothetical protein
MLVLSGISFGIGPASAAMFSSLSAEAKASAAPLNSSAWPGSYRKCSPATSEAAATAIALSSWTPFELHPHAAQICCNSLPKRISSIVTNTISNSFGPNGQTFDSTRLTAAGERFRGVVSRMISACWSRIVACWALLIASSNTNKKTVHSDSTTTPTITSHFATRWTEAEYSLDSNIIPAPTAIPANTLPDMSTKWGQNGSAVPESNALTYIHIPAILAWLFAAVAASIASVAQMSAAKFGNDRPMENTARTRFFFTSPQRGEVERTK